MRAGSTIYLDYMASTPVDKHVRQVMYECDQLLFANPHATQHSLGQQAAAAVEKARAKIESIIGAKEEEVIFTSGATEANNHAIASVLFDKAGSNRNTVLISAIEHKCIKNAAYFYASKLEFNVREIPVQSNGIIDLEAYKAMLSDNVALVCIMAVNNEIGVIQDIKTLSEMAHSVNALFHCDAAQAPIAIDINVHDWDVDTLSLSGHKIYGPKGIGILFIKNALQAQLPPFIHGGGQQGGVRSGTVPTELCVGMAEALFLTVQNATLNRAELANLKESFVEGLRNSGIKFVLNGDQKYCHPGNINVQFEKINAPELLTALHPDISASTGSACNSEMILPSHVLKALGLTDQEALSSVRFSLGRHTDEGQILDAIETIKKMLPQSNL
jgi:cysteine desulfurase